MLHSADRINAFAQLGVGTLAYLKVLDRDDVLALVPGADVKPGETACALVDADGSPILLRGSIGACLLAAEEGGLHVVPIH